MKSTSSLNFVAAVVFLGTAHASTVPARVQERQYGSLTYKGCYSSGEGLTFNTTWMYNSKSYCQTQCVPAGSTVQATTNKKDCWCGDSLPDSSDLVSDTYCNDPCAGFDQEMCGSAGSKYFSVYLTGLDDSSVETATAETVTASSAPASSSTSSSTPSSTISAKPSVVTIGGETVVVTASSSPRPSASHTGSSSGGGPSKTGIAAGVVVGVVVITAIAGGLYLFIRSKRRREVEEEYKRNAAVSNFIAGGKPPTSSSGASSFNDTRLDPVMAHRRMSDGSIMDNEDYSRRILKVTNA